MRKIHCNLRCKIFLIVFVGLLLSYSLVGTYQIYQVGKNFKDELNRSGQERVFLIAEAVANMMVAYDYSNLEGVAERISKLQDVQKINIFNRNGKLMVTRNSSDFDTEKINLDKLGALFEAPIFYNEEKVGTVELIVSRSRYDALISTNYRQIVITIVFSTIFIALLIYFTVSLWVARPLLRLSRAAERLADGDYAAELPAQSHDEIGNLVGAFAMMRESRKENEARLQAIFDNSPDAFVQCDAAGNIVDWNDKAEVVWGYARAEILGKHISTVILPVAAPELNGMNVSRYSENISSVVGEMLGRRKDGSQFLLELRTSEIRFSEGSTYLLLARDITERKENENKLTNAMNVAESANAAKSAFLSNISHEIRTPMNSIIGMTNLALKTELDPRQHDYLVKIGYSAHHLLGLINDILDFSKIEASKLELEVLDFDLNEIFANLSNQISHDAEMKALRLEFELDPKLLSPLRGDPLRLMQILLNFTSNAIKFTFRGSVTVRAHMVEEKQDDVLVHFDVVDTGIGIASGEMQQLFQAFHQADASTTRKYGGTGLGLVISKQLVELMGGSVGVNSLPNQGSQFWFEVWFSRGKSTFPQNSSESTEFVQIVNASVLLVEDNLFNQQVAVEMLRAIGARVSIANNGREAMDMLQQHHFDCVLMDVQMPVMDGLEATRQIRANPALCNIHIIAMTANAGVEDRERCFAAGMNNFITKPIMADKFYTAIKQGMRGTDKSSAAPARPDVAEIPPVPSVQQADSTSRGDDVPLIDLTVLAKSIGHDPAILQEFARKFLHNAQQGLAEIQDALDKGDMTKLAALGHRNKSPARTVGAMAYAELCLALEKFKLGGDPAQARDILSKMQSMLAQINEEIG